MTKLRDLSSIESGLAEAIRLLKNKGIEDSTGKSSSFIRKCSDPKLDQQIDHRDSIKIDKACIQKGIGHPLLQAHQYIIANEIENIDTIPNDMDDLLVKFTILHGKLMGKIKNATDPDSPKGSSIDASEKKEIFESVHDLEKKITKIKQIIEKS